MSKLKNKLLKENSKISWVPEHIGSARFKNGIESAPDWAISRSRYSGAPLPVWRHSKSKEIKVIGSVEELLSMVRKSGNAYFVMRHGEAHSNLEHIFDSYGNPENHLTEHGRQLVLQSALKLKREGDIDMIVVSPLLRTRETAKIVQDVFGLPDSALMIDERLREMGVGASRRQVCRELACKVYIYGGRLYKRARGCRNIYRNQESRCRVPV